MRASQFTRKLPHPQPDHPVVDTGVHSFQMRKGIRHFHISCAIVFGNSGGPVLLGDRVIGVAFRGSDTDEAADQTDEHGVIPVSAIRILLKTETPSP